MGKHRNFALDELHEYGVLLSKRTLYTKNEVDFEFADKLIKNIHYLESLNEQPITIIMNCIGGNAADGLAVFDTIVASPCDITIKVVGDAQSMGGILLQCADVRMMSRNSTFMMHYGTSTIPENHSKNVYRIVEHDKKFDAFTEQLFLEKMRVKNPDIKLSKVKEILNFDTIMSAQEALDLGLIDLIAE